MTGPMDPDHWPANLHEAVLMVVADVRSGYPDITADEAVEHAINVWVRADGDNSGLARAYQMLIDDRRRQNQAPYLSNISDYQVLYAVVTDGLGRIYITDDSLRPDPDLGGYVWVAPGPDDVPDQVRAVYREIGIAVTELLHDDHEAGA